VRTNFSRDTIWKAVGRLVPRHLRRRLRAALSDGTEIPAVGQVDFGDLRRLRPFCNNYGLSRGTPVDRIYIQQFLERNKADVRGHVLEVANNYYTKWFGAERAEKSDVLHVEPGYPGVTIVGNLETGANIPSDTFDCFICTQTLNVIYDFASAMRNAHRCLKAGGVLLLTVEAIGPFFAKPEDTWGYFWRLTSPAIKRLSREIFGEQAELTVTGYGNLLTAASFLYGLASSEITENEYAFHDPAFEIVVSLRGVKR
jgi:SAM-dependent methyltransferase